MNQVADVRVTTANFKREQVEDIYLSARALTSKMSMLKKQGRLRDFALLSNPYKDVLKMVYLVGESMSKGKVPTDEVKTLLVKSSQLMGTIVDLYQVANVPREFRYEVSKFKAALVAAGINS